MSHPLRGGAFKKIAYSSSTGTDAEKLAEIYVDYNTLTAQQKLSSFMAIGVAIYPMVTTTGVFVRPSLSNTVVYIEQLNLTNSTFLFSQNGTISNLSNTSNDTFFELWIKE